MLAAAREKLEAANAEFTPARPVHEILSERLDPMTWDVEGDTCVECAACTNICPTCHCFYLLDVPAGPEGEAGERYKVWDSCILGDYSRMAGVGGMKPNPRPEMRSRFANRVLHKFHAFPENFHRIGCTGCGRCIAACFGGSDLRRVLKELEKEPTK
jgi:ferredoxin